MKRVTIIVFVFLLITGFFSANSQTYKIPDINLKNKLITDYPSLMDANGDLVVASANAFTSDLILEKANIADASGLECFTSTKIVRLTSNNLTSIPQLSRMINLRRAYLSDNDLTSLPVLTNLTQLIGLTVINNKLTNLNNIQTGKNLQYIYCSNNQIAELPDLSALVNLKTLSISFNPISAMPDLSRNINLQQLDIKNTNINSIPSLSFLLNLEVFNCENNKITDLSGLSSNNRLITLTAQNNSIHTLPSFIDKTRLANVNLTNNKLTFEDIIPLTTLGTFSKFSYAPQKQLDIPLYVEVREKNNYTYQLPIDQLITTNQYTWSKNNNPLPTSAVSALSFTPVMMSDSGSYYVTVLNPSVPLLVLKSNISRLTVRTCMEVIYLTATTLSSDCRQGSKIDFNETTIEGALQPVYYSLKNINTLKEMPVSNVTQFEQVTPGLYTITITDSRNCIIDKPYTFDDFIDCDHAITPNGDGIMDDFFIAETGTANVYSVSRKLIKTFSTPDVWDGTTDNGSLADAGYYVIIVNGSTSVGVSLIR